MSVLDTETMRQLAGEAVFEPTKTGYGAPSVTVAGVRVAVYLVEDKDQGATRVRISVDLDESDERLRVGFDEVVPMALLINGQRIWES